MKRRDFLLPLAPLLLLPCLASGQTPPSLQVKLEIETLLCEDFRGNPRENDLCQIGDWVTVDTINLNQWIDQAAGRVPEKLLLVLNGHVLEGNYGERASENKLSFRLRASLVIRGVWPRCWAAISGTSSTATGSEDLANVRSEPGLSKLVNIPCGLLAGCAPSREFSL